MPKSRPPYPLEFRQRMVDHVGTYVMSATDRQYEDRAAVGLHHKFDFPVGSITRRGTVGGAKVVRVSGSRG